MSVDDWHADSPPLDAYSRVTDPGRFGPLHPLALDLLDRLGAGYDVTRTEAFDPLPGMGRVEHARAPVRLTPATPAAAPVGVAFTPFPSLLVRCGRFVAQSFPGCACDACGETADGEGERLRVLLDNVVAGRFREAVALPLFGRASVSWEVGARGGPMGHEGQWNWSVVTRPVARALVRGGPRRIQWQPWPRRPSGRRANGQGAD